MRINLLLLFALTIAVTIPASQAAYATQEKMDFAAGLEEALGHFRAIELNLDDRNAELAITHATHPISELYDAMKPLLQSTDPELDEQFHQTLLELKDTASVDVSRAQAQEALDDATTLLETVRDAVVGEELSADPHFKLQLIKTLLETSIAEYGEAVSDGEIVEQAEFQDGWAFVWRSQQIVEEIKTDIDVGDLDDMFDEVLAAYDEVASPSEVERLTTGVISQVDTLANDMADERLEFAAGLEEALGHFRAIELNLDDRNAELAITHATHPISELYDAMKPLLAAADPSFDENFEATLTDLKNRASVDVNRAQAQEALDGAADLVEDARDLVVGELLSTMPEFKLKLMKTLLETSIAEYGEAVSDGEIVEQAEFQDGQAFVWRSQQIFDEIQDDIDAGDIDSLYNNVWVAYATLADPSIVAEKTGLIINAIDRLTGSVDQEKLDFAAGLEEALGHFRAIELNLDDRNAELAITHATHPISELYDAMKPLLQSTDPELDEQFHQTLLELKDTASVDVSRAQAQEALDDATTLLETVRDAVVGEELSADPHFKLRLIKTLLETSIAEYGEAVSDGQIVEQAEFQDGQAFVWRSEQIFDEIRDTISADDAGDIESQFIKINEAYENRLDAAVVEAETSGIISRIDSITGDGGQTHQDYIDTIRMLLTEARANYLAGDTDLALSQVTKAYLDNYEFLEAPLIEVGERDFMVEVEISMRQELRTFIKDGAPASQVVGLIDHILEDINKVESLLSQ